jgi:hypothetical protein
VSIETAWPIWMSLACVSAIFSSALSFEGFATRAIRAGRDLLSDFDRHELQHAGEARAHAARRTAASSRHQRANLRDPDCCTASRDESILRLRQLFLCHVEPRRSSLSSRDC